MNMTAKDLLHKFIEYESFWDEKSKPGMIRIKQIESLQSAFHLMKPDSLQNDSFRFEWLEDLDNVDYLYGDFIEDRPESSFDEIKKKAVEKLKKIVPNQSEDFFFLENKRIEIIYNNLVSFRIQTHKFLSHEDHILEGIDAGFYYSETLIEGVKEKVRESLYEIDDLLWSILDPLKRDIELNTLIEKFNYPEDNLEYIEAEWKTNNL